MGFILLPISVSPLKILCQSKQKVYLCNNYFITESFSYKAKNINYKTEIISYKTEALGLRK